MRECLTGQEFGLFEVGYRAGSSKSRNVTYECRCLCGTVKIVRGSDLKSGATKSCGCLNRLRAKVMAEAWHKAWVNAV